MTLVFDSSALIASLHGEPGGEYVQSLLSDPEKTCIIHAINICEVYYEFKRTGGEAHAQAVLVNLREAGIMIREDMDDDFWQEAGQLKADIRRISLADCFCAALASRVDGEVVTADKEFAPLADSAYGYKVNFIR